MRVVTLESLSDLVSQVGGIAKAISRVSHPVYVTLIVASGIAKTEVASEAGGDSVVSGINVIEMIIDLS